VLAALATLVGYTIAIDSLPDGSRPDVLQVRPGDRALFVGDAKATETAGNEDTARRLSRYASFLTTHILTGRSCVMALAVSPTDRYDWMRLLRSVSAPNISTLVNSSVDVIDNQLAVVWLAFGPAT
jgi:hypothetical protein